MAAWVRGLLTPSASLADASDFGPKAKKCSDQRFASLASLGIPFHFDFASIPSIRRKYGFETSE